MFSDLIDGYMARTMGVSSKWGAFLDSTLDRLGDAAIFAGLAIWLFGGGHDDLLGYVALWALVMGSVTSYTRAKAESLGMTAKGGIAERADRLVAILVLTFWSDVLDLPILLAIVLWVLAAASTITVVQRMILVRRQALADPAAAALDPPPAAAAEAGRLCLRGRVGGDSSLARAGGGPAAGERRRPGVEAARLGGTAARGQPPPGRARHLGARSCGSSPSAR